MRFCLLFLFLFNASALAAESIPKAVQQAEKAVWEIGDGKYSVAGSFISPTLFATSLDAVFNLNEFNDFKKENHVSELELSKNGERAHLILKKIHNLSLAHNLIIFETYMTSSNYLKFPAKALNLANSIFTINHSDSSFMRVKNETFSNGNPTLPKGEYLFTGSLDAKNASGVPVLNSQGKLMGIMKSAETTATNHHSDNHFVTIIQLDFLKKLMKTPLSSDQFASISSIIEEALTKEKIEKINFPSVKYILGIVFEDNKKLSKKYKKRSIDWYQESAERGYALAQTMLGFKLNHGKGIRKNIDQALNWYEKAVKQNDPIAQFELANMYYEGRGVSQSDNQAIFLYELSAKQNHPRAQFKLAMMYSKGEGVEKNDKKAFQLMKSAAQLDDIEAQFKLANMYYEGKGIKQNFNQSFGWITEATDTLYKVNPDIKQFDSDAIRSFEFHEKLAKQGHAGSQHNLAVMLWNGNGTFKNIKEAISWYKIAAEQGHAHSQMKMGNELYSGKYIEKNLEEGTRWYQLAAEQGDTEAQYQLGKIFRDEIETNKNREEAAKWFKKAAEKNHTESQFELANMYYQEKIRDQKKANESYKKAMKWYERAALKAHGHAEAKYQLGVMYYNGEGIKKNYEKAHFWYLWAANDHVWAKYYLAELYYKGEGVEKNLILAEYWFKKFLKQRKFTPATDRLKNIRAEIRKTKRSNLCKALFN